MAKKSVASVLGKFKGAYKDAILNVDEAGTIPRLFLDSPSLNFIFGGGFGLGRILEFYGPESGGKSTLATYIAGEIQKKYTERPVVVYVDFERSFDKEYAENLGLNTDEDLFIFLRPENGEIAFQMIKELLEELPVGLIIWDSIATAPSVGQVDEAFKATYGAQALMYSNGLRYINPYLDKHKASLIMVNQERANITTMLYAPTEKTAGGYAVKFYASWRGRITRADDIKEKGITTGIVSRVRNTKNKMGIPKRTAELQLYFNGGFDSQSEYIAFLVDLGIVKQGGAWFSQDEWGMKVQGRNGVEEFLLARPELFESVKKQVNEMMAGTTELDREGEEEEEESEEVPDYIAENM